MAPKAEVRGEKEATSSALSPPRSVHEVMKWSRVYAVNFRHVIVSSAHQLLLVVVLR